MNPMFNPSPKGWSRNRLRFCVESIKNGAWGEEPSNDEYDVICIRVADFDWEHLRINLSNPTLRSFSRSMFQRLQLKSGDILLEKSGGGEKTPVGRAVKFEGDFEAVTSNFIARVRPSSQVASEYLLYLLAAFYHSGFAHQFIKQNTGIQNLDDSALFSSEIWLPDLDTQKKITEFLNRETEYIEQLIEKREKFLAVLEEKKAALAAKAVDGSIVENSENGIRGWFGTLPVSWNVKRAKFLFRERQDRSATGDEELLTVSHITGVTKRSEKNVNMFLAESMEGYKLVFKGDVVINTMWAWMGAMGVSSDEGLISPSYGVYSPSTTAYEGDYLDLLLRSRPFIAEATRRSKGIHSSRLRLYPDAFLDILLPVPPRAVQKSILVMLNEATKKEDQLANLSLKSLDRLYEFRSALITAAVTGQIDVTTWNKRGLTDQHLDAIEA
jgi:type I restriction enzyme, S subunit